MQQEQRQLPQPAEDVISLQQELTQKDNYIKALQVIINVVVIVPTFTLA